MCDPVSLIMAAGTAVSTLGGIQQAGAQASAYEYQAKIGERNATLAEARARDALKRGAEAEARVREEGGQFRSGQMADFAAAGLDLSFGSPLDVLINTTRMVELDAVQTRKNFENEARDYDIQAWNYRTGAVMDRASAAGVRSAGIVNTFSTVLGGYSDIKRYQAEIV